MQMITGHSSGSATPQQNLAGAKSRESGHAENLSEKLVASFRNQEE